MFAEMIMIEVDLPDFVPVVVGLLAVALALMVVFSILRWKRRNRRDV